MEYIPNLLVLALYIALFIRARGFFKEGAQYLFTAIPAARNAMSPETVERMLLILFAANLIGAAATANTLSNDTAARGYLLRNEYGSDGEEASLTVELDGKKQNVELHVPARCLSDEEIQEALDQAEDLLPGLLLKGLDARHVDRDLTLPAGAGELPVTITWDTGDPEVMDWEGVIGDGVSEAGEEVVLTATLACDNVKREKELSLRVYPRERTEREQLTREVEEAVRSANDETEETVLLPSRVDGREAVWSLNQGKTGLVVLLLGALVALLYAYTQIHMREEEEKRHDEEMLMDYPNIVSKLVLLVTAGMSLRKAFARIRSDYRDSLKHGAARRAGYEEIVRMSLEMEHGVSELVAYENMGKRTRVSVYRTFSTLLVQNLTKGGSEMAAVLAREAEEACEDRKKRARILGEEAGTKLLLPMLLMLGVVMVILMVPAFFAFF